MEAKGLGCQCRSFSSSYLIAAATFIIVLLVEGHRFMSSTPDALSAHHFLRLTSSKRAPALTAASWRLDTQCSASQPGVTCAMFILYSWNYDMFWTSLQSYAAAGLGRRIIIIDNSADHVLLNNAKVAALVGEVMATRAQLTFSQLQNFIADVAIERNLTYYFWGHADVAVLASNASASFVEEVTGCVDRFMVEQPSWGVLFFRYDMFAAFRTDVMRQVRWDTFIHHYMADCDMYPRVRAAGWRVMNHKHHCPEVAVKVFDLKVPVELPVHDYERAEQLLRGSQDAKLDRNEWRRKEWSIQEQSGYDSLAISSRMHYRAKWGIQDGTADMCGYPEVNNVTTGDKELRQQPFENRTNFVVD